MVDAGYSCHETSFGWVAVKNYPGRNWKWLDAVAKCSEDGTELPTPRSPVESDWFVDKSKELGLGTFWLGVNDRGANEGEYKDQHGSPHNYFKWAPNNPTGDEPPECTSECARDCVQTGGVQGWRWDDTKCWDKKDILCTQVTGKTDISIKIQSKRILE